MFCKEINSSSDKSFLIFWKQSFIKSYFSIFTLLLLNDLTPLLLWINSVIFSNEFFSLALISLLLFPQLILSLFFKSFSLSVLSLILFLILINSLILSSYFLDFSLNFKFFFTIASLHTIISSFKLSIFWK
jgi:hypothetical protein